MPRHPHPHYRDVVGYRLATSSDIQLTIVQLSHPHNHLHLLRPRARLGSSQAHTITSSLHLQRLLCRASAVTRLTAPRLSALHIRSFSSTIPRMGKERVAIIGSGNWFVCYRYGHAKYIADAR